MSQQVLPLVTVLTVIVSRVLSARPCRTFNIQWNPYLWTPLQYDQPVILNGLRNDRAIFAVNDPLRYEPLAILKVNAFFPSPPHSSTSTWWTWIGGAIYLSKSHWLVFMIRQRETERTEQRYYRYRYKVISCSRWLIDINLLIGGYDVSLQSQSQPLRKNGFDSEMGSSDSGAAAPRSKLRSRSGAERSGSQKCLERERSRSGLSFSAPQIAPFFPLLVL